MLVAPSTERDALRTAAAGRPVHLPVQRRKIRRAAVPAGLAMLIGQMLNTFGTVQTYEHAPTDAVGRYVPATQLAPAL